MSTPDATGTKPHLATAAGTGTTETRTGGSYLYDTGKALCLGSCGLVDVADLIADDNDPPGRCPGCGGQTCQCRFCARTALSTILGPDTVHAADVSGRSRGGEA